MYINTLKRFWIHRYIFLFYLLILLTFSNHNNSYRHSHKLGLCPNWCIHTHLLLRTFKVECGYWKNSLFKLLTHEFKLHVYVCQLKNIRLNPKTFEWKAYLADDVTLVQHGRRVLYQQYCLASPYQPHSYHLALIH